MFRTLRVTLLMVLLGVVLTGCRTNATVGIQSNEHGRGLVSVDVTLDREATRGLGTGSDRLVVTDLAASGWAVDGVEPTDNGGSSIHLEKAFTSVGQANAILTQLTGDTGALSALRLERKQTLTGLRVSLTGNVDLRKGLGSFGDAGLKTVTGSSSDLGIDDAEVARQAGAPLNDAFRFALTADLLDTSKRWKLAIGSQTPVALVVKRFAYEIVAGVAAMIVAVVGLIWLLFSLRRRARES